MAISKFTKQQFLNICLSATKPSWADFLYNIPFVWDVNDTATEPKPGLVKKETDARAISRSILHGDGWTRCVLAYQIPLIELMVNTVQTEIGTVTGVPLQGRGLKVTPYEKTLGTGEKRLNFIFENSMVLSNVDTSMTIVETAPNTGNYVLSCPTTWAHKMKLLVGGVADYLGNKLMNSLYISADTLGVKHIDSSSITLVTGATGVVADIINDPVSATIETIATGIRLANAANYILNTGDQTIGGVKTFTSDPLCAVVPTTNTMLTNKLYVDTQDATKVGLTGNEVVAGIKTFSSFPVTPSSAPTISYQVSNKKYVDDEITSALSLSGVIDTGWIELTNAEALQSFTSPKTYIVAPAVGTVNIIQSIYGYNKFGTAAFVAAEAYKFHYENLAGLALGTFLEVTFVESVHSVLGVSIPNPNTDHLVSAKIIGGTATTDMTLGDGSFYFRILYKNITLPS